MILSANIAGAGNVVATWQNNSTSSVFLYGCGTVSAWKLNRAVWTEQGPAVLCTWEGASPEVPPGVTYTDPMPFRGLAPGTYRFQGTYGVGCTNPELGQSKAGCTSFHDAISNVVMVGAPDGSGGRASTDGSGGTPGSGGSTAGRSCGNVGQACSGETCGAGLSCSASGTLSPTNDGLCVPSRGVCGGVAAWGCEDAQTCFYFTGSDAGVCITQEERACLCASTKGPSIFDRCPNESIDRSTLHQACGADGSCPAGLTRTRYYGISGALPLQCSCEISCAGDPAVCPSGTGCAFIDDGPGYVCSLER